MLDAERWMLEVRLESAAPLSRFAPAHSDENIFPSGAPHASQFIS